MAAEFVRYDEDCGQEPFTLRLESAGEPTRCANDTSPARSRWASTRSSYCF